MVAKKKTGERSSNMKSSRKVAKVGKTIQKKVGKTIQKTPIPFSPQDDSPIRAIFCLKKSNDMKRFEETEDCFILGFNPFESVVDLSKLSLDKDNKASADGEDLSLIAEKGQVACRDYPHPRHLCLKFPFKTTPHASYCERCYCYVCDSAAPCKNWTQAVGPAHCNAERGGHWECMRHIKKKSNRH